MVRCFLSRVEQVFYAVASSWLRVRGFWRRQVPVQPGDCESVMVYTGESEGVTGCIAVRQKPRLLDEVRRCLRLKHHSLRTEQAYVAWIRRFILASGRRRPREMGVPEVERFLTGHAVAGRVLAGTQNQAMSWSMRHGGVGVLRERVSRHRSRVGCEAMSSGCGTGPEVYKTCQ